MGWTCISETCNNHIIDGQWDGTGAAYYSIADDISQLYTAAITWFFSIASWVFIVAILLFLISIVLAFLWAVNKRVQSLGGRT
jgi:hypothetical protein